MHSLFSLFHSCDNEIIELHIPYSNILAIEANNVASSSRVVIKTVNPYVHYDNSLGVPQQDSATSNHKDRGIPFVIPELQNPEGFRARVLAMKMECPSNGGNASSLVSPVVSCKQDETNTNQGEIV